MKRAWFVCAALAFCACRRPDLLDSQRCAPGDAGTPVDPKLLAFLSRARAAHHLADTFETADDLTAAAAPLVSLVAGPFPHAGGSQLPPEVNEVLADTFARLADFHSRTGAFDRALADVRAGLTTAGGANYFQGHLLETEGLVEERLAKSLEISNPSGAAEARQRAIGLLESAMTVQSGVIEQATVKPNGSGISAASATPAPKFP